MKTKFVDKIEVVESLRNLASVVGLFLHPDPKGPVLTPEDLRMHSQYTSALEVLRKWQNEYEAIEWTQVKNDYSGNPRFVCHFTALYPYQKPNKFDFRGLSEKYADVLATFRKLGGRKFHNKQYGGGVVFQTYDLVELENQIDAVRKNWLQ